MKNLYSIIVTAVSAIVIFILLSQNVDQSLKLKQSESNLIALNDTLEVTKNRLGETAYTVKSLVSNNSELLSELATKDTTIARLQKVTEAYKKELKKGGEVIVTRTETRIDTFTQIIFTDSTFNYSDDWISLKGKLDKGIHFSLSTSDMFSIVTGYRKENIFSKREPFVEITSSSPYTTVTNIKSLKIVNDRPKINWLSITAGPSVMYLNNQFFGGISLTLGPSYFVF